MTRLPRPVLILGFFLLHSLDSVSGLGTVQASIGGSVLLPCVYSGQTPLTDSTSVFWRDRDDSIVLDIRRKVADLSTQSPRFRGRVSWDETLFRTGNFSIQMRDVQQADGGSYECHIPSLDFQDRVTLAVSDQRGPSGGSRSVTSASFITLLSLVSVAGLVN